MNGNVTIGMSFQAPVMGYTDATEHYVVTIGEGVNIQALPNPQ